jgi:hypothetical protein
MTTAVASRVSADGLRPAALVRGGSKGPSEGPFLGGRVGKLAVLLAALAVVPAGCSLAFVNGPPPNHQKLAYFDCSSSRALPTLDVLVAGAATVDAIPGVANGASGLSSNRANLAVFGTEAALFAASAIYGYSKTAECREAQSEMLKRAARTPTLGYPPGYGGPYGRSAPPPPYDPWVVPPPAAPPPPVLSPVGPLPPATPASPSAPASPASGDRPIPQSGKGVQ